jgi:FkbM family methyltransferase
VRPISCHPEGNTSGADRIVTFRAPEVFNNRPVPSLLDRVSRHRWIHQFVGAIGIYQATGFLLHRFPVRRRLKKKNGMVYRISSLDQLGVAGEMFGNNPYEAVLTLKPIDTFIDLGCNSGWFALWLAAELPNANRVGLLVDANQRIVREAAWHLNRNGIANHDVVFGAVGLPPTSTSVVFNVYPNASQSSLLEYDPEKQLPVKGKIKHLTVPAVSMAREWRSRFGDKPVDLVKIDIEGNELDLIRNEGDFIREKVRGVILEWHKWHVSLSELDAALGELGLRTRGVYRETDLTGVAFYVRD